MSICGHIIESNFWHTDTSYIYIYFRSRFAQASRAPSLNCFAGHSLRCVQSYRQWRVGFLSWRRLKSLLLTSLGSQSLGNVKRPCRAISNYIQGKLVRVCRFTTVLTISRCHVKRIKKYNLLKLFRIHMHEGQMYCDVYFFNDFQNVSVCIDDHIYEHNRKGMSQLFECFHFNEKLIIKTGIMIHNCFKIK